MNDADQLLTTVRDWMGSVRLGADGRLPPERELASTFAVGRSEMRKVLATLEAEGAIWRRVGKGTFLTHHDGGEDLAVEDIAAKTSPLAAMQARAAIEPELARLAALNATSQQIGEMRRLCEDMRQAQSWDAYAELDWRFHNLIAEATGNVLLVQIQRLLNGVRRFVVWGNLVKRPVRPPSDYHSFAEHAEIIDALEARDAERAMRAMRDHLGETSANLVDQRMARGALSA